MIKWLVPAALLVFVSTGGLGACGDEHTITVRGSVLSPGQSVEALNHFGKVRVSYISPTRRKFEWDGASRTIDMTARKEPFHGMLGLYDPADCFLICFELPRLVVAEAKKNFRDQAEIDAFLYEGSAIMDWVHTTDGLVVGFGRDPSRMQVNIDVYQVLLRGRKPDLSSTRPGAVRLVSRQ